LRPLVAKTCDFLVTLPMKGKLDSLNVAAVAAILSYELVRQRGAVASIPKQGKGI
jgi:23S rRNA (guanosine2251-2'-O)-methyltransferase